MTIIESMFNYSGSKHKLINQINPYIKKDYSNLYDLFCGRGEFFINTLNRFTAITANDIITPLINFYIYLQSNELNFILYELDYIIKNYNLSKENKDSYINLMKDYNENNIKNKDVAFYLLICHSFSNMIKFNNNKYVSGFGKRTFNLSMKNKLINYHNLIKKSNIQFLNKNYYDIQIKENSLIYLDPPYYITNASYNKNWSNIDEIKLYEYLDDIIKNKNIDFILSNMLSKDNTTNNYLLDFINRNNLTPIYLNMNYNNTNGNKSNQSIKEVLITNIKD